jgi:hypothetical protein
MSYKWEMNDGGKWISNGLRFATREEAVSYGENLAMRWLVPLSNPGNCRATECDDPETLDNGAAFKPAGHRVTL